MKRKLIGTLTALTMFLAAIPSGQLLADGEETIGSINVTIAPPEVGSVIKDETTKPVITLESGANYRVSWTMYIDNLPSADESYDAGNVFGSTVEAGEYYYLEVYLSPNEGYLFDCSVDLETSEVTDNVTLSVTGAETYELGYCSDMQYAFFAKVKAEEAQNSDNPEVQSPSSIPASSEAEAQSSDNTEVQSADTSSTETVTTDSSSVSASVSQEPSVTYTPAEEFVVRSYDTLLGRAADEEGMRYWVSLLNNGTGGTEIIKGFIGSQEFIGRDMSDEYFVDVLYRVFFNRTPDDAGREYWLSKLASGVSRDEVLEGFIGSEEWVATCDFLGISQ